MESYVPRIDVEDHSTGHNMLTYKPYRELRAEIVGFKKKLANNRDCPAHIVDKLTNAITANTIKHMDQ